MMRTDLYRVVALLLTKSEINFRKSAVPPPVLAQSLWAPTARGLLFAIAASAAAFGLYWWPGKTLAPEASPFLFGMLAVVAAALGGGGSAGAFAALLSAVWCGFRVPFSADSSTVFSCFLFAAEGLCLSYLIVRSERALTGMIRSERWYRTLTENLGDGVCVTDEQGFIIYSNARLNQMLGSGVAGATGRDSEEFCFPEDLPVERIRRRDLLSGQTRQYDRRLRRADGSEVWVLASSVWLGGQPGISSGLAVCAMTEITERKATEQVLRRSEERFRSLVESLPHGVYQTSPQGKILEANPALLKLLGVSGETELAGLNVPELYPDPTVRHRLTSRLELEGELRNVEYELRRRDGQLITVQENARSVRDQDGRVAYYEGTLTDVSDLRKKESQLLEASQLSAVCELTSSTADDFIAMLERISAGSEKMLADLPDGSPNHRVAMELVRGTEKAAGLAAQLVSFSRRYSAGPATVDLNRVLVDCEGLFRQVAGSANLNIAADPGLPLPVHIERAHADFIALRLLLYGLRTFDSGQPMELRTGTIEFAPGDSDRVLFSGVLRPGVFANFSLTGSGWDPLRDQNSKVGTRPDQGGLEKIILQYGGFSSTETLIDGRHRLSVCFPRAGILVEKRYTRETILLVDDDALVRELSQELLEIEGYRVVIANSAEQAEAVVKSGLEFDLLITDVIMPDVTGTALVQKLRTFKPELKVLFVSGYSSRGSTEGGPGNEDAFLAKPFSANSLAKKIREVLDKPAFAK